MVTLVFDFCPVNPAWADSDGNSGHIPDSWLGRKTEEGLIWDGGPWPPSSYEGVVISNPAQFIDTLPSSEIAAALHPFFSRALKNRQMNESDWLVMMLPTGVSTSTQESLSSLLTHLGWKGGVLFRGWRAIICISRYQGE